MERKKRCNFTAEHAVIPKKEPNLLKPTVSHFERAALDISAHGDSDAVPFDMDVRFCGNPVQERQP